MGQRSVNGGIAVWLCSNLASRLRLRACSPARRRRRPSSVIMAADVVGPAGRGIAAGEFEELLRALRGGNAYANVHTGKFPGGEVRSRLGHRHDGQVDWAIATTAKTIRRIVPARALAVTYPDPPGRG